MDVFHARFVAAAAFLLGATGLALIAWNVSGSLLYTGAGVFLFAFTIGAEGDFIPFFVRRYFGLRCFGTLYGVLFLVYALGGVVGPVLYGFAFDSFGGYSAALHAGAAACLACAGAVIGLGPYSYR